jgi:hypothetical protein
MVVISEQLQENITAATVNTLLHSSSACVKSYGRLLSNFHICYTHKNQDTCELLYVVKS